ncbi:ABC transporter substrate-binding protein [Microbacterium sp. No. 7]|uniref:ABC transporter substrate-binding protein n=1 Tax=Microbacterium sp. No. 7 TaxID=1714373 RepID=UPI0006D1A2CE|nr:sugar ABC transporter substrate-binding protein [Microbacterium sp. No. 7]ALJ21346.1 sugar ABC transporter substrate-binding protein [Microbacterium sp. No. 7]
MRKHTLIRGIAAGAAALLVGAGLAACASDGGGTPGGGADPGSADAIEKALEEGGELTYWTWTPSAEAQVAAFEDEYPNVKVTVVNTASANDNNLKLQNAIAAGSGAPDVVQLEYQSLPQFILSDALLDLTEYGFAELEDLYTPGPWSAVSQQGGIWGLPQDSGPMALFYNKRVFDEFGLEVPATWDEYVEAGRKLHAADPSYFITNDSGTDAGFGTSMIWQAGGRPFQADGETITIDLADEGTLTWASTWDTLVQEGLISQISGWTDEWFAGLSSGKIATLPIGAWMPGVFESGAAAGAGDWRVAPMPTYDGGTAVNSENGGSSEAVTKQSKNPALAAGFLKWLNSSPSSIEVFLSKGGFPATVAELTSDEFLDYESDYFGGQKINQVLVDAANAVTGGWQYLPWQSYANSIYADTVGKAYLTKTPIADGLAAWQEQNVSYGTEQGFTIAE